MSKNGCFSVWDNCHFFILFLISPQDVVLMRALRDMNLPKFVFEDVPLFLGLIGDLFPGLDCPRVRYPNFNDAVEGVLSDNGYILLPHQVRHVKSCTKSQFNVKSLTKFVWCQILNKHCQSLYHITVWCQILYQISVWCQIFNQTCLMSNLVSNHNWYQALTN